MVVHVVDMYYLTALHAFPDGLTHWSALTCILDMSSKALLVAKGYVADLTVSHVSPFLCTAACCLIAVTTSIITFVFQSVFVALFTMDTIITLTHESCYTHDNIEMSRVVVQI